MKTGSGKSVDNRRSSVTNQPQQQNQTTNTGTAPSSKEKTSTENKSPRTSESAKTANSPTNNLASNQLTTITNKQVGG